MHRHNQHKNIEHCAAMVRQVNLNLTGKKILTECASGGYLYTPVIALLAGCEQVVAFGKDTRFGLFKDNAKQLVDIAKSLNVDDRLICSNDVNLIEEMADSFDIVTNSGMLRPIEKQLLSKLKPAAFVALMWEPWEFRQGDIDLQYCQQNHIPIVGSNELNHKLSLENYPFLLFIKAAMEMNCMVTNQSIAVVGGPLTGELISKKLSSLNIHHQWFTEKGEGESRGYVELRSIFESPYLDILVIAEHLEPRLLLGKNAELSFTELFVRFPGLKVIHICGNIDSDDLTNSGLSYYPQTIRPFGYMSFQPADYSAFPAIQLNTVGLKAAEVFASEYKQPGDYEKAIRHAVDSGYVLDFPGGFYNYSARDMKDESKIS